MNNDRWMMQYPITLPADYDMQIIRDRVRLKGSMLDGHQGMEFKAYAIRERGVDDAPVNQYAPFYVWSSTTAAAQFLTGPDALFGNIIASFGRPQVRTWLPVSVGAGAAGADSVDRATQWNRPLPADADPTEVAARLTADVAAIRALPAVHRAAAAIDPSGWQATLYVTSAGPLPTGTGPTDSDGASRDVFQVLHLSEGSPG